LNNGKEESKDKMPQMVKDREEALR